MIFFYSSLCKYILIMNNQNDLIYNISSLSPILDFDLPDFPNLDDDIDLSNLPDLDDDIDLSDLPNLDDDIDLPDFLNLDDDIDLLDLEFDENLVDDLGVFTPPSSPKSVLQVPKPISDIFDFFFYR